MSNFIYLFIVLYFYFVAIPINLELGKENGIKFCIENLQKCKVEYLKLKEKSK